MRKRTTVQTTIIRRSARRGNNNVVASGAWKVAFADFTLAMMALFMVLWIVNAVPEEDRQQIIANIKGTSIFQANPFSPISTTADFMGITNNRIVIQSNAVQSNAIQSKAVPESPDDLSKDEENTLVLPDEQLIPTDSLPEQLEIPRKELEELILIIMKITEEHNAQSNLQLDIVPQGLRILLQDDQHREMFQRGDATLTPFFQRLLKDLAPVFSSVDNKIVITGHTDSTPYPKGVHYNNWNLSGERALAAREALEQGGVDTKQVIQVSGMADQMLLDDKDPKDMINRRIEILLLTRTAAGTLYQFFGHGDEKSLLHAGAVAAKKRQSIAEMAHQVAEKVAAKVAASVPVKTPAAGSALIGVAQPARRK